MLIFPVSTMYNSQVCFWKQSEYLCKCKSYSHLFCKTISVYAIFNGQSFNDSITNDIISFEQLGPGRLSPYTAKQTTIVTLCLRSFRPSSFWKGDCALRNEFGHRGSGFVCLFFVVVFLNRYLFKRRAKTTLTECVSSLPNTDCLKKYNTHTALQIYRTHS